MTQLKYTSDDDFYTWLKYEYFTHIIRVVSARFSEPSTCNLMPAANEELLQGAKLSELPAIQIGRASCRERC